MIVSTFEPVEVGQAFETIPDHMTWISWFNLPDQRREDFASMLEYVVEENRPPTPVGGSLETFGDESLGLEDVRRFDRAVSGFNVLSDFFAQAAMYAFAKNADPGFKSQYFGIDWNPHTKAPVQHDQEVPIDNLTVFTKDKERRLKVVRNVVQWEGERT